MFSKTVSVVAGGLAEKLATDVAHVRHLAGVGETVCVAAADIAESLVAERFHKLLTSYVRASLFASAACAACTDLLWWSTLLKQVITLIATELAVVCIKILRGSWLHCFGNLLPFQ